MSWPVCIGGEHGQKFPCPCNGLITAFNCWGSKNTFVSQKKKGLLSRLPSRNTWNIPFEILMRGWNGKKSAQEVPPKKNINICTVRASM